MGDESIPYGGDIDKIRAALRSMIDAGALSSFPGFLRKLDQRSQAMDRAVSALQRQHRSDGKPSQWRPEF